MKLVEETILYILDMIIQNYGSEKYSNFKTKRLIKRILLEDEKRIRKIFVLSSEVEIIEYVYIFLCKEVFRSVEFFSTVKMSKNKEDEIFEMFCEYASHKGIGYVGIESKAHLVDCINFHNNQISNKLLDSSVLFGIKVEEKNYKKLNRQIDNIINTLNKDTDLQNKDITLDYLNLQLESSIRSLKIELQQNRNMQVVYIKGVILLLIAVTFVTIFFNVNNYTYAIIIIMAFASFVFIMLFIEKTLQADKLENRILTILDDVYQVHFKLYEEYIKYNMQTFKEYE